MLSGQTALTASAHLGSCRLSGLTLDMDDHSPPGTFTLGSILMSRKPPCPPQPHCHCQLSFASPAYFGLSLWPPSTVPPPGESCVAPPRPSKPQCDPRAWHLLASIPTLLPEALPWCPLGPLGLPESWCPSLNLHKKPRIPSPSCYF